MGCRRGWPWHLAHTDGRKTHGDANGAICFSARVLWGKPTYGTRRGAHRPGEMERVKEVLGYASEKAGSSARHDGAARRDVGGLTEHFLAPPAEPATPPPVWLSDVDHAEGLEEAPGSPGGGATGFEAPVESWVQRDAEWDRGSVSVLTALGFTEPASRAALSRHGGSLDLAMAFLCAEEIEDVPPPQPAVRLPHASDARGQGCLPTRSTDAKHAKLDEPESAKAARAACMRGCAARPGSADGADRRSTPVGPTAASGREASGQAMGGRSVSTERNFAWPDREDGFPATQPHLTN